MSFLKPLDILHYSRLNNVDETTISEKGQPLVIIQFAETFSLHV